MPEVQYNPQGAVWTYTYAEGSDSGRVFFHSPQPSWSDQLASLVLRQVNSTDENKVWINKDPSLVVRCDEPSLFPTPADAHGVITCKGLAKSLNPSREQVTHRRGERIWVEHSLNPASVGRHNGLIPVVSLDTLEHFEIPYRYICFVPQISRLDSLGKQYYGIPVGPVRNHQSDEMNQHRHKPQPQYSQAYVEWPASQPQLALLHCHHWDSHVGGDILSSHHGFRALDSAEERRQIFQTEWVVKSQDLLAPNPSDEDSDRVPDLRSLAQVDTMAAGNNQKDSQLDPRPTGPVNENNCRNPVQSQASGNRICPMPTHCSRDSDTPVLNIA